MPNLIEFCNRINELVDYCKSSSLSWLERENLDRIKRCSNSFSSVASSSSNDENDLNYYMLIHLVATTYAFVERRDEMWNEHPFVISGTSALAVLFIDPLHPLKTKSVLFDSVNFDGEFLKLISKQLQNEFKSHTQVCEYLINNKFTILGNTTDDFVHVKVKHLAVSQRVTDDMIHADFPLASEKYNPYVEQINDALDEFNSNEQPRHIRLAKFLGVCLNVQKKMSGQQSSLNLFHSPDPVLAKVNNFLKAAKVSSNFNTLTVYENVTLNNETCSDQSQQRRFVA